MPTTATVFLEVPCLDGIACASDAEVIAAMRAWGAARRTVDAGLAQLAGVVAARSSLELGYDGLAQRAGARSPEAFVSQLTGTSGTEARAITTVGTMMNDPAPWMTEVVNGVTSGSLSVGAAAAIQTGLGTPSSSVAADDLADAAHSLLETAGSLPPEKVARAARAVRDELDEVGVGDREEMLRGKRALYLFPQSNGMTRITGLLDPESAALVTDAIDAVTSPKRGGPRFVDSDAAELAQAISDDPREPQQLALDALVEMVRIAVAADTGRVFGLRKPSVSVHVTASDFAHGTGVGHLEGQTAAVSMKTVERLACTDGFTAIQFDDHGQALRLGLKPRTFTDKQKTVLAAIWGGCAVGSCDKPPSWTEAHHIRHYQRDHGPTDIDNGILLCRFHHLLIHNNGWDIRRADHPGGSPGAGIEYLLEPPPHDQLTHTTQRLVPKNPVYRRARKRRAD
jgi:hypothetical protein